MEFVQSLTGSGNLKTMVWRVSSHQLWPALSLLYCTACKWLSQALVNLTLLKVDIHTTFEHSACSTSARGLALHKVNKTLTTYYGTHVIQVASLASATLGVAPLASLAPVTWAWCCMGAEWYRNITACCLYVAVGSQYITGWGKWVKVC